MKKFQKAKIIIIKATKRVSQNDCHEYKWQLHFTVNEDERGENLNTMKKFRVLFTYFIIALSGYYLTTSKSFPFKPDNVKHIHSHWCLESVSSCGIRHIYKNIKAVTAACNSCLREKKKNHTILPLKLHGQRTLNYSEHGQLHRIVQKYADKTLNFFLVSCSDFFSYLYLQWS